MMRPHTPPGSSLSILLTGVGGQGVVTAAGWLAEAASLSGHRVVVGQAHNMSRRGGSTNSVIIIDGGNVPELPGTGADILVAAEPMEAARLTGCLRPGGLAIVDPFVVAPATLAQAGRPYPPIEELLLGLRLRAGLLLLVEAHRQASELGHPRNANVILLGALQGTGCLPWSEDHLERAVLSLAPPHGIAGPTTCLKAGFGHGRLAAAEASGSITPRSTRGDTP